MTTSTQASLTALSPLDGRYAPQLSSLAVLFSEASLIRYRLHVEVEYILWLEQQGLVQPYTAKQRQHLRQLVTNFSQRDAQRVQELEARTRHDVKAVEYFLRDFLKTHDLPNEAYIHLGLTSEDTNALAYGLMLRAAQQQVLLPELDDLLADLASLIGKTAAVAMPGRTHGQRAVPTTVGKELAVFAQRLLEQVIELRAVEIEGKLTGAVGTLAAHAAAFPELDVLSFSEAFVRSLGLKPALVTTQVIPPESYSRLLAVLLQVNSILLDLSQDCWRYISDDYFGQQAAQGQVGSSTMPQKINPIDFENAEGNLGLANTFLIHFLQKLPVSRLQRDLSDSTVKRNLGSVLGYCLLAYRSLRRGLSKIRINETVLRTELLSHWEVLAEAYQVVLRRHNVSDGYEQLQQLTQGKTLTRAAAHRFLETLKLPKPVITQLKLLTPLNYTGTAEQIATLVLNNIKTYQERSV